jgi:hypothetical protein
MSLRIFCLGFDLGCGEGLQPSDNALNFTPGCALLSGRVFFSQINHESAQRDVTFRIRDLTKDWFLTYYAVMPKRPADSPTTPRGRGRKRNVINEGTGDLTRDPIHDLQEKLRGNSLLKALMSEKEKEKDWESSDARLLKHSNRKEV